MYQIGDTILVNDLMQKSYEYMISATMGDIYREGFEPYYSPKEMLSMGVFEGKYCNDCRDEFPGVWYEEARVSSTANPELNYFGVKSRQGLSLWRQKGWIVGSDPRGWFQWYCRYYLGRRIPDVDLHQIKRWRAFKRHIAQVVANCEPGNWTCRPRQRQALLQWSHNALV